MRGNQARLAAAIRAFHLCTKPVGGAGAPAARGDEEQEQFRGSLGWIRPAGTANHPVLPGKEGPPQAALWGPFFSDPILSRVLILCN